jgi:uncharacterized protein YdaU (DUF1376 family)
MHYYKRNIGDYHKKAGRLTMLQHGAFTLLMDSCYDRERFPTRDEALKWLWASSKEEIEAVEFVLSRFFDLEDGVYVQKRIADEIANYQSNAATNKRIAIERETKRREKRTNRARLVNGANTLEHEPPPNQEPRTTNQEPVKENTPYQAVLDAYHANLPMLPGVQKLTDARKRHIKARWSEFQKSGEGMNGFQALFNQVGRSSFLKEGQFCNLEWMTKEANYVKIMEGNYINAPDMAQQQVLVR